MRLSAVIWMWFALMLAGCATLPGAVTGTVAGRQTEYVLSVREGSTPVIFENGLGGTLNWWTRVYQELAKDMTVFAYNRPGYGHSLPPDTSREGLQVAAELRALLRELGVKPPYILVGHSLGGLYLQAYARQYPDEVRGLVLVDSTHPRQLQGDGAPEHWPWWVRRAIFGFLPKAGKAELAAVNTTGEQVLALPAIPGNRVMILSALKPMEGRSRLARDANAKRVDLARLYPGARQVWVESGHGIPLEKPEAVVEAVREVMKQ